MASNNPPDEPWLSLRNLEVGRQNAPLLRCAEFDIRRGEFHVLTGKQGGGKSILCNILRGEMEPAGGSVSIDGRVIARYGRDTARKMGVEAVGSLPYVFPHLTVAENISISLARSPNRHWFGKRSLVRRVAAWLEEFGIHDLPLDVPLDKVTLNEHLFIQVLSCLFNRPRLLILDETLENLSVFRREQIMAALRREMAAGLSVLWATHQLEDGWRLADRLTIVRHGKILLTDLPGNIDRRSLLRLAFAQFPETEDDDRDRERFFNLVLYTEALLKELPLAIIIVDTGGTMQFANRAGRTLLPGLDGGGGQAIFDLLERGNGGMRRAVERITREGGRHSEHAVAFLAPGGELTVDYQAQAVVDGMVTIGAMLIIQDVSERERLRNRLILSHNVSSVGLLAAGVAHDVNNPLSAIGNYLSYLMRKLPEGEVRDAAERVGEEARNIQSIIDNLVAFSGHHGGDHDVVDLHGLALDLCTLLRFKAESSGTLLNVTPPPEGVSAIMTADVKEMRQLLLNLIRNAIEAMPGGGEVTVDFSAGTAGELVIRVLDTGPGVAFERVEDIFEPFVSTKSDDDRYHGIGLTIVYSLVEKYRGSIAVTNMPEGGCCFTLRFRAADDAA